MLELLVTAYVVPSLFILSALLMNAIISSETSVLTRATRRHIPEDGIPPNRHFAFGDYLGADIFKQEY
jgi:heme O synthase-like polyprenyltransferase